MSIDETMIEDDDDTEFEDAVPADDELDADASTDQPKGLASGPQWARIALAGFVLLVIVVVAYSCRGGGGGDAAPKATSTTVATVDPLAERPKVNPVVSAVVGKSIEVRQKIADVVNRAEKNGAPPCSLFWGMNGEGWSIEYQHPGSPPLPNATHNVPVFVDTRCYPTPSSPLPSFAAVPAPTTTTRAGGGLANGAHPALNPTSDQ